MKQWLCRIEVAIMAGIGIDPEDLLERMQRFAALLDWEDLNVHTHVCPANSPPSVRGRIIRWYEAGDQSDVLFQINELPSYCVAVYALRYRICTGWHIFHPYKSPSRLRAEAQRLHEWVWAGWFRTPNRRREFRLCHPDCANYSWQRIRL